MFDMVNRHYMIKQFLDRCSKTDNHHPQNPIIRYYTDQFLNGKINSQDFFCILDEKGSFQSGKKFIKTIPRDHIDAINSDDKLRKIIREEIYQSANLKEKTKKINTQSKIRIEEKKRRGKRGKKSLSNYAPIKIASDDPKIKRETEATNALLRKFEETCRKDMEMGSPIRVNHPSNINRLNPEQKKALIETDQYRMNVNDKQKRYWGSS